MHNHADESSGAFALGFEWEIWNQVESYERVHVSAAGGT